MYINLHAQVKPKDLAIHGEKDVCVASDWSFSTRAADQTWIYCCGVSNAVAASSKKGSGIEQSSSPTSVTKVAWNNIPYTSMHHLYLSCVRVWSILDTPTYHNLSTSTPHPQTPDISRHIPTPHEISGFNPFSSKQSRHRCFHIPSWRLQGLTCNYLTQYT